MTTARAFRRWRSVSIDMDRLICRDASAEQIARAERREARARRQLAGAAGWTGADRYPSVHDLILAGILPPQPGAPGWWW